MIHLERCQNKHRKFQCTFEEWVDELAQGGIQKEPPPADDASVAADVGRGGGGGGGATAGPGNNSTIQQSSTRSRSIASNNKGNKSEGSNTSKKSKEGGTTYDGAPTAGGASSSSPGTVTVAAAAAATVVVDESDNAFMISNEHFKSQHAIAQMEEMHYHYRLRMTSATDRQFFWKNLVKFREIVTNVEGDGGQGKHRSPNDDGGDVLDGPALSASGDGNTTTTTTTTMTTGTGGTKEMKRKKTVEEKFLAIPNRTIDLLAALYHKDLELWQQFLDHGTPRQPGAERTMYDYYLERKHRQNEEEGRS
jgi:hypothetical protein